MRLLIYLFVLGCALSAQRVVPIPFPLPWPALREYLVLSEGQLRSLSDASQSYWIASGQLMKRREELQPEILVETSRSPLRPVELGRLHEEWETIRRRLVAVEKDRIAATRAVLNELQLVKLRALDELATRREVIENAASSGLSPTDCGAQSRGYVDPICEGPYIPSVTKIPDWGSRPEDYDPDLNPVYPRMARYLGLTMAQYDEMMETRIRLWSGAELTRMRAVVAEIHEETRRDVLDSFALGVRYAEVEALRRKMSEDERKLTAASVALLTPAQRVKLDALTEAMRLRPTIEETRSAELLGSRCNENVYLIFENSLPRSFGLFRTYLGDCPDKRALEELPQ
jgi:hypothetical protein